MNRSVPVLLAGLVFLTLATQPAQAQRTGSLQVTAQVVDSRAAWSGLESAQNLASSITQDSARPTTIQTAYAKVSLDSLPLPAGEARAETPIALRIDYLRN